MSSTSDSGLVPSTPRAVDVAIIGAGVSGLACAARLRAIDETVSVAILEARDRIGGRACSINVGGFLADVGAGWIHGIDGNPLLEDGIITLDDLMPCSTGNIWTSGPSPDDSSNFHPAKEETERWCRRLANFSAVRDAAGAMGSAFRKTGEDWTTSDERQLRAFELWFGAPIEELEVEWSPEACLGDFPGPHALVREGMSLVAERLLERAGGKEALFLKSSVEAINEDQDGITLHVETEFGSTVMRAQQVVCTIPLGMLQQSWHKFYPPCSTTLLNGAQRMRMSTYCKCILVLEETAAAHLPTWTWTDNNIFPMAFNYYHVKGTPLVVCTSINHSPELLEEETVVATATAALGVDACHVMAHYITRWHNDAFTRGAYSFLPFGCDFCEIDNFLNATADRRLCFAGEHTHEDHQGSVHGAYLSGLRAADATVAALARVAR